MNRITKHLLNLIRSHVYLIELWVPDIHEYTNEIPVVNFNSKLIVFLSNPTKKKTIDWTHATQFAFFRLAFFDSASCCIFRIQTLSQILPDCRNTKLHEYVVLTTILSQHKLCHLRIIRWSKWFLAIFTCKCVNVLILYVGQIQKKKKRKL